MITIINYGLGNIKAFVNIYKNLNIPYKLASNASDLKDAKKIILPGVGAFDYTMERLRKSGMKETLHELVLKHHVPVLGICVGMQMLARSSEEGILAGLDWIEGDVKKFNDLILMKGNFLPHMGWNQVRVTRNNELFQNIDQESRFYFLHSYYFECNNNNNIIAVTDYGDQFASAVNLENIYGVQFHPEKSHSAGIQLLKNFADL